MESGELEDCRYPARCGQTQILDLRGLLILSANIHGFDHDRRRYDPVNIQEVHLP